MDFFCLFYTQRLELLKLCSYSSFSTIVSAVYLRAKVFHGVNYGRLIAANFCVRYTLFVSGEIVLRN